MKKMRSEKGSVTVFVIVTFLFCMTVLVNLYWTSTNYQVTALQAEQRIKSIYGNDVNNIDEIYNNIDNSTIII